MYQLNQEVLHVLRLPFTFGQRKALEGSCVRQLNANSTMSFLGPFVVRPTSVLLPKVTILHKIDSTQLSPSGLFFKLIDLFLAGLGLRCCMVFLQWQGTRSSFPWLLLLQSVSSGCVGFSSYGSWV